MPLKSPFSLSLSHTHQKQVLGDPLLRTQHLVASSRWYKSSPTLIHGYHQLRVPHQKYTDATLSTVKVKGHAHGTNKHWYRRVTETASVEENGDDADRGGAVVQKEVWKFAGLAPDIRWSEYDFEKVFEEGRGELGEGETAGGQQRRAANDGEAVEAGEKEMESEKGALAGRQEQGVVEESVALGLGVGTGMAVEGGSHEGDGKAGGDGSAGKVADNAAAAAAAGAVVPGVGA